MNIPLCLPMDDVTGPSIDFDRAADFLELTAFFAAGCKPGYRMKEYRLAP